MLATDHRARPWRHPRPSLLWQAVTFCARTPSRLQDFVADVSQMIGMIGDAFAAAPAPPVAQPQDPPEPPPAPSESSARSERSAPPEPSPIDCGPQPGTPAIPDHKWEQLERRTTTLGNTLLQFQQRQGIAPPGGPAALGRGDEDAPEDRLQRLDRTLDLLQHFDEQLTDCSEQMAAKSMARDVERCGASPCLGVGCGGGLLTGSGPQRTAAPPHRCTPTHLASSCLILCDTTVPMVLWATDGTIFFLRFVLTVSCAHVQQPRGPPGAQGLRGLRRALYTAPGRRYIVLQAVIWHGPWPASMKPFVDVLCYIFGET